MEWIDVNNYTPSNGEYLCRILESDEINNPWIYYKVLEIFMGMWVIENDNEDSEVTHWCEITEPINEKQ